MTPTNATLPPPRYLRASGACAYFNIGRSTLWAWCKTRHDFPKPIKAGPRVTLFDVAEIERFISSVSGQGLRS